MKTKTPLILTFLLIIIGTASCKDKENLTVYENTAIITYSAPATDGCGWIININQKEYYPINLTEEFRINGLNVNIKYNLLPSLWECPQWVSKKYQEIKIINITKIEY